MALLCLLVQSALWAGEGGSEPQKTTDNNIVGHVIDARTKEHIPYVTIFIKGTTIATSSDASGHFYLKNLPAGTFEITASLIGYISETRSVRLGGGETQEINFLLKEDNISLEQVVVSASRTEITRKNSPSLVNLLSSLTFDITSSPTLAEGLNFQPGVRVENDCQNCGFTQVRLNGLDGHYSQILMDSHPIFSALTGVYGLEQIPASMIDRVEIVKGGGSALFGSSAVGGTINIITKDPVRNSAEIQHSLTSIGMGDSFDNNSTFNLSLVTEDNKAGLMLFGQNRNRDSYDANGDGYSEIATMEGGTVGFRSFLKTSDQSKITLQYHNIREFRRGGSSFDLPPHEAEIAEQTEHSINGGSFSFDMFSSDYSRLLNIFTSFQNTSRDSYYGSGMDPNAYGSTHDLVSVSGVQYTHKFSKLLFMPAEFVAGIEYSHNDLTDRCAGYNHHANQKINIFSGYLQNEWRTDKWGFLLGGRLDKHNLLKKVVFSPRANVRFNPNDDVNFRLSYSTGFRAPQAFDEDFHIAIVGGERVVTVLAEDLKEESSESFNFSADLYPQFGDIQTNFTIDAFHTSLKDVFVLRSLDRTDAQGNSVLERYNGTGAAVTGVSLDGKAVFPSDIQLQAGITYQKSRYKEAEQWSEDPSVPAVTRMFRTPDLYGYFTATFNPFRNMMASITGTYTGEMLVQHMAGSGTSTDVAVTTPDFLDMNIKLSYDIKLTQMVMMELNAGVQNLFNSYQKDFDTGEDRDSGYMYGPPLPRSLFFGVKFSL